MMLGGAGVGGGLEETLEALLGAAGAGTNVNPITTPVRQYTIHRPWRSRFVMAEYTCLLVDSSFQFGFLLLLGHRLLIISQIFPPPRYTHSHARTHRIPKLLLSDFRSCLFDDG